jgi:hypothetical protein
MSTISPPPPTTSRPSRRRVDASPCSDRFRAVCETDAVGERRRLARYACPDGGLREVLTLPGAVGSVLVVDRDAHTLGDRRLVAHLAADEPPENAALVCESYMRDVRVRRCRCRRVTPEDLELVPFTGCRPELDGACGLDDARDRHGNAYWLEPRATGMTIPELRWRREPPSGASRLVSVRDAIAGLESYEPVRTTTLAALTSHHEDPTVSTVVLRGELERLQKSTIVLNRGLREAVLAAIERQGLSMSQIALRCGRVKRDANDNESGETSWLARRLGLLPEGGLRTRTPWIHSDVLALIARRGLGISPHEVELG